MKYITIVFFLLVLHHINAQPPQGRQVTITGKVIDTETGQPLEYATITFTSSPQNRIVNGGITDSRGNFSLQLATGTYNISIEYISFKTYTITEKRINGNEDLGTISLELDTETLQEIEIIAERTTVELKLDKKIYNVGKDLTVSGGTVSDVLDNVPSVSVDAEGNVALRGNDNVRILINGKPSALVGLNSTDALRQLPAESIEKVEVITSPSARYEAEGTAGILNIILRRSKLQGFNGAITANAGHPDAAGISGNINFRTGDVNFFNTSSYRYTESIGYWYNKVSYINPDTPDLDEKRDWTNIRKGFNTNTGLEWYINDSASLTAAIVYSKNDSENNSVNKIRQIDKVSGIESLSLRLDPEQSDNETTQYSLNYAKNFKTSGHKLTFDFQFENSDQAENSIVNVDGIDTELVGTIEDNNDILLQADYVLPIGENGQVEVGYRGNFNERSTDYSVAIRNPDSNEFELDTNLSNLFNFDQDINAVYAQYGYKNGRFSYLLGLRMENTRTTLDQPTSGDFKKKNLTGLFPTVNATFELSEDENIILGYNRRLRRPWSFFLNPFPSRSSITNVFQGNPDLDPTYTSKFELGYLNDLGKFIISSAIYYSHSINVMTFVSRETGEIVTVDGEEFPVIERGPINLATDDRYGAELNITYSPSRKWRVNTDFNVFRFKRNGIFNEEDFSADNVTWSARLNNRLTLPHKIVWQTSMNYRGPSQDNQNNRKGRFGANVSFSKDLFKEKASLAFNIRDVFNSRNYQNHIVTETFMADQDVQYRGGRTYNIAFTYRFNQKKKRTRGRSFDGGDIEL